MTYKTDSDRVYLVQFNIAYDGSINPSVVGKLITPHWPMHSESSHFTLVREVEAMLPKSYRKIEKRFLGWEHVTEYDRIEQSHSYIHFDKAPWLDKNN